MTTELEEFEHVARTLQGVQGRTIVAAEPVDASSIRRFAQAIMDTNPLFYDADYARSTRFGQVVAPPLFPLHALRLPMGSPDPLDAAHSDPDFDGAGDFMEAIGLPALPTPLRRLLNGGNEITVLSSARLGDMLRGTSTYDEIFVKHGKNGPLVFAVVRTEYEAVTESTVRHLMTAKQTYIWR